MWPEIWDDIAPLFVRVQTTGEPVRPRDQLLAMRRKGFTEECYFDFTFSPIRDETGAVGGIFDAAIETTARVLGDRRTRLLRDFAAGAAEAETLEDVVASATAAWGNDPRDLPWTLLYLAVPGEDRVRLTAGTGFAPELLATMPAELDPHDPSATWPFGGARELGEGGALLLERQLSRAGQTHSRGRRGRSRASAR